jgi:hypothetical protein
MADMDEDGFDEDGVAVPGGKFTSFGEIAAPDQDGLEEGVSKGNIHMVGWCKLTPVLKAPQPPHRPSLISDPEPQQRSGPTPEPPPPLQCLQLKLQTALPFQFQPAPLQPGGERGGGSVRPVGGVGADAAAAGGAAEGVREPAAAARDRGVDGRPRGAAADPRAGQGLTLVHFSAQLEPCLTQENTLHTLHTP